MIPLVEMKNICKSFPGVTANHNVNLAVMPGEIHALLGENGAGKTTLMSILSGMYRPDSGEIMLHGKEVALRSPNAALSMGIGMIYQHFMLVPDFTVAQNVILGNSAAPLWLKPGELNASVGKVAEQYGFNLDPSHIVGQLSIGEKQRVEILRTLYQGSEVLILDEPTTVLTPAEVQDLFVILKNMARSGKSVILITHKLNEVMQVADTVTVLRKGENAGSIPIAEASEEKLARMMIGREMNSTADRGDQATKTGGQPLLSAWGITVKGDRGHNAVKKADLTLVKGEILAIAGVAGNGQHELVEALAGLRPILNGTITLNDNDITALGVRDRVDAGIRLVPEDRLGMGLVGNMGTADNLILRDYYQKRYGERGFLNYRRITERAAKWVNRFQIAVPDLKTPVKTMSGGNLQRLLLAREILQNPEVIIACYPTRGLDVAAAEAVYHLLRETRERGAGILLIMEDLDEIIRIADRVAVMYNGNLSAAMMAESERLDEIGRMMGGMGGFS